MKSYSTAWVVAVSGAVELYCFTVSTFFVHHIQVIYLCTLSFLISNIPDISLECSDMRTSVYSNYSWWATLVLLNSYCNAVCRITAWINPMVLTFPSCCGESNLPYSVASVGGSPPDDISCCEPSIGGQRTPWGVIKTPEKSSLTPAT